MKVVGFLTMKKTKGVVVFVINDADFDGLHGQTTDKLFIYGDLADKITDNTIGHTIEPVYGCGYNGKAFISDLTIK